MCTMKKQVLALAAVAVLLAACGKKEEPAAAPAAPAPAAAPAAPPPPPPPPAEEKVLNIYNWPDYMPEGMIAAFEKETGIKVNYDTFETNEALHAKLVAGNTGYDIVVPGVVFAKPQIEGGLFQPLDKAKLIQPEKPGSRCDHRYWPRPMQTTSTWCHGPGASPPWASTKTKVEKALGKMPMPENAWDLVFKPEYTAKLKSCGIAYLDSPTEILPVALHYVGKNAYSNDAADYKVATDMLAKVRKDIRLFSSTMIDDIWPAAKPVP
jgi:putrescine transport system substrate-binding protein